MKLYFLKPPYFLCFCIVTMFTSLLDGQGQYGSRPQNPSSQSKIKLKGAVVNATSKDPLEYATISIYKLEDASLITEGITDNKGIFELNVDKVPFAVKIEFLGFEAISIEPSIDMETKFIDLGIVALSENVAVLEEVEIRAEKSQSQFYLDKQVFNVGKDLANRGGTAEDILDNVPSVTVDIEGVVSLRGNSGVRILVNGQPSGLVGADNGGLRSIPANLIDRIEVITNPSARYEAEGTAGIINIVLKQNKNSGFNGSIDVNGGYPLRYGIGLNLNYRKNKINWFINYGLNYQENDGGGFTYQERLSDGKVDITNLERDFVRTSLSNSIRFGADYFFDKKQQLTLAFLYDQDDDDNTGNLFYEDYLLESNVLPRLSESERMSSLNINNQISYTSRVDDEIEDERDLEYSLNYRRTFSNKDHKLSAQVQFTNSTEVEGSDFIEDIFDPQDALLNRILQRSRNDEGNKTLLFQSDYQHAFSKYHKWETGVRVSLREIRNDFTVQDFFNNEWVAIDELTNDFIYDEDIYAAYGIYGNSFDNFSYQLGARVEYADILTELQSTEQNGSNPRDFLNLFPSGFLNYKLSDANAFQMSYSRRVSRPRFWFLNPFFTFTDSRNFFSGNPNVNPEFTDSYEISNINFWEDFSLTSALFYRSTTGSINRLTFNDTETNTTITVPLNTGNSYALGLDVNFSITGIPWLRLDGNFSFFNNQIEIVDEQLLEEVNNYFFIVRSYDGTEQDLQNQYIYNTEDTNNFTWNGRLTARFKFWDSDLQLRGNYRAPNDSPQGRTLSIASLDIGWSKDITKDLSITISGRDVFNSRRRRNTLEFEDFFSNGAFQWRSRVYNLNLNYRINQKKKRGRPQGNYGSGGEGY